MIREKAQTDPGIRQAIYPEETIREQAPPVPAAGPKAGNTATTAASPRKAPAGNEPPVPLPEFVIQTKPEEPLVAALRCFLDKRPAEAVDHLTACDKGNQEALLCLLPLAVRLSEGHLDQVGPQETGALLDELHSLELPLLRHAPLRIEKMCFCRSVNAFGLYEPLADGQAVFEAGSNGQSGGVIQVYAEVRNFTSASQGPYHVTRLVSWGEIRDYAHNKAVARIEFENRVDESRSSRHDYFIKYIFRVPKDLPPGPYTLWICIQDALAQPARPPEKRSLDFRVIASGAARGSRGEPGGLAGR
jgi:hypothetical protein